MGRLITLAIFIAVFWFSFSQILIPLWRGTKMFWFFRRTSGMYRIGRAREHIAENKLTQEADLLEVGLIDKEKK
jgi:hypothetical protein